MKLDTKQKVLIAVYIEYQKDFPDMEGALKPEKLGLGNDAIAVALLKLQNERLITGVSFPKDGNSDFPKMFWAYGAMMTREGMEYVETKISISRTLTGGEKIEQMVKDAANWGWEQAKDITARTLAEMSKP